jgi:uncharacterized damage-inducible protein DinB
VGPVSLPFPEPTTPRSSHAETLLGYLDYFRSVILDKLDGLADDDLRTSRLPSGWTPLELLQHLVFVERRWLVWGFLGRPMADPWGDRRDDRWHVEPDIGVPDLVAALQQQAAVTREIVESHRLDEVGQPGERWAGAPPATLERILLHLVQEYARHAGHLDIVRELTDGRTGE